MGRLLSWSRSVMSQRGSNGCKSQERKLFNLCCSVSCHPSHPRPSSVSLWKTPAVKKHLTDCFWVLIHFRCNSAVHMLLCSVPSKEWILRVQEAAVLQWCCQSESREKSGSNAPSALPKLSIHTDTGTAREFIEVHASRVVGKDFTFFSTLIFLCYLMKKT